MAYTYYADVPLSNYSLSHSLTSIGQDVNATK